MRKKDPEKKKLDDCLKDFSPDTLWEYLSKNHSEWLYNNQQHLSKHIQISLLD